MLKNNKDVMNCIAELISKHSNGKEELAWEDISIPSKLNLIGKIIIANDYEVDVFGTDFAKRVSKYCLSSVDICGEELIDITLLKYYDKIMRRLVYSYIEPMYVSDMDGITTMELDKEYE